MELARRCMGTLEKVQTLMREEGIDDSEIANMDETSMRVFSLDLSTLQLDLLRTAFTRLAESPALWCRKHSFTTAHWKGAKRVPVEQELQSKLTLSMAVIWYGDGTMEFCVVWKRPGSDEVKWECVNGVWWLQAPSKFSRKSFYRGHESEDKRRLLDLKMRCYFWKQLPRYTEVVRFFVSRGKNVRLYIDDMAPGHSGIFRCRV